MTSALASLFAVESGTAIYQTSGWFLENVWLVPFIPAMSFLIILFFGKKLPNGGAPIGIAMVGVAFVLSVLTAGQWISQVNYADSHKSEAAHCESLEYDKSKVSHGDDHSGDDHGGADDHGDDDHSDDDHGDDDHGDESGLGLYEGEQALAPVFAVEAGDGNGGAPCPVIKSYTWWSSGGHDITVGTMVDGLTVTLLVVVTLVSLLVNIYSTDYVAGDRRYTHFFAFLSLFTAAMLFYVVSESVIQMIVGWELVGVCSFTLIGHWWEDQDNSDAALKAFLTNRVGDIGLLIGMIMLFFAAGQTSSVFQINAAATAGAIPQTTLLIASLCLLAAVMSKSGQFILHTWLPDAMAGPTPVSALIHAATMVVAGIYMIARLYGVFFNGLSIGGSSINALALIGAVTCLFGAMLAFVQDDIKKVLAYSTISQLGYMALALGVGAWTAAIFHLMTHAFFKACLFLGAGSVAHSVHSFDMKKDMGGMRKFMPHTYRTFLIGSLALMGLPPLAGFWSKDEILAGTGGWGVAGGTGGNGAYTFALVMGIMAAMMTAAYMTRVIYLTFFGEFRHVPHGDDHAPSAHADADLDHAGAASPAAHGDGHEDHAAHDPHESGPRIVIPLYILAFLAIVSGFLNFPKGFQLVPKGLQTRFEHFVEPRAAAEYFPSISHAAPSWTLAIAATGLVLLGAGLSWFYYFRLVPNQELAHDATPEMIARSRTELVNGPTSKIGALKGGHTALVNKYYLDHIYDKGEPVETSGAGIMASLYGLAAGLGLGITLDNGLDLSLNTALISGVGAGVTVFAIVFAALKSGTGIASFTKGLLAEAADWSNKHLLDGVVDNVGKGAVRAADVVYKIDQGVVDGAVNAAGRASSGAGGGLRRLQTGKVQQYATYMFAAAAVLAGILIVFN